MPCRFVDKLHKPLPDSHLRGTAACVQAAAGQTVERGQVGAIRRACGQAPTCASAVHRVLWAFWSSSKYQPPYAEGAKGSQKAQKRPIFLGLVGLVLGLWEGELACQRCLSVEERPWPQYGAPETPATA